MLFAENFVHCFFSSFSLTEIIENDIEFFCEFSATTFHSPDLLKTQSEYIFLQSGDQLTFTISFGEADPVSFHSSETDFNNFKKKLDTEYVHQEGEAIIATFTISKSNISNRITIYDLEVFSNTIEKLNSEQSLSIFSRVLFGNSSVIFNVLNLDKAFGTASIFFVPVSATPPSYTSVERQKRLDSVLTVSNYANYKDHGLTPDDFRMQIENVKHDKLCLLFNRFAIVLSVVYLFDITTLKANELDFKINGYKSIKGNVDVTKIRNTEIGEYFSIYNWVYTGGNLNDKIGLARNIISLHFVESGKVELKGNPFQSIQSSYKVYEKQNIKQYIEIRNKISDQLLDFNSRANRVIETFAGGFQKSALALITFYFSSIAIKVFGKGNFVNVFTLDTTVLALVFLIGSFIYYLVARWEVKEQKKRFIASYTNLKERYTDLLEKDDIKRILNNDKEFNADVKFIDDKLKNYSKLWLWFLGILLFGTLFLFFIYNVFQLFAIVIWKAIYHVCL
jgi:hypothetical protein